MVWEDLKTYIGSEDINEDAYIEGCWDSAVVLIDAELALAFRPCPDAIKSRMYLEVGNELYNRRNAVSGSSQFAVFEGGATQPVRGARDPLAQIRPLLARYVCPLGPPAPVVVP